MGHPPQKPQGSSADRALGMDAEEILSTYYTTLKYEQNKAGGWRKPASPCEKRRGVLPVCSIVVSWDGDIFHGSPRVCTTSQRSMNSFDASRTAL